MASHDRVVVFGFGSEDYCLLRISAIVDAGFGLIADGVSA
jgi:hypothetical protein